MTTVQDVAGGAAGAPLTFGPPERALFGWFHTVRSTRRDVAVLLCNPVGWEGLVTHRTYRELAERLSAAGFATLRFDLDGTGDSAGGDEDVERVAGWMASIDRAAAELRTLSGLDQISVFGIQLGATLAAQVAASSAVLWAPLVQGRQLSRQIRAYGALNDREPLPGADQEAGGFLYRGDTLDTLSSIDLLTSDPPAPQVLLLQKDAGSNEVGERLASAWRERGAEVTCEACVGYGDMMQEPRSSRVPEQMIDRVVEWLAAAHPSLPARPQANLDAVPHTASQVHGSAIEEELCFFGPDDQFFGIVTRAAPAGERGPAVVFLNTSSDYRVGPSRMYVPLSRQLAALGFASIRFDPTGIGDHRGPGSGDPAEAYSERRLAEVTVVLDFLESRGVADRFILVGLCSGAYVAFHAALRDTRVVGTVVINPQTFTWKDGDSLEVKIRASFGSSHYYADAMRSSATWKRVFAGQVNLLGIAGTLASRITARIVRTATHAVASRWSTGFRVDRGFQTLLDRGSQVLVIFDQYDGGRDVFDGHVGKDGGALRRNPRFHLEIVRGADHTFSRVQDQRTLFALLRTHLDRCYPA